MTDTPAGIIDSRLFRDQFGTEEMRAVFSDEATLNGWLEAECALAEAQADLDLIPQQAAQSIVTTAGVPNSTSPNCAPASPHPNTRLSHCCVPWKRHAETLGSMSISAPPRRTSSIPAWCCKSANGLGIIEDLLVRLIDTTKSLARTHKATPMAARTHGQHAVPTTLGFKLAVFVTEFNRHADRLDELKPRLLVGQLAGAAGTLATLGESADAVRHGMMNRLGLGLPDTSWHTARDGIAECIFVLSMIATTCGKLANEVINLQRTEIAEVAEPAGPAATGSSTMPQKRNPMTSQSVLALSRLAHTAPAQALDAMMHEHERDLSAWQIEWAVVPQTFVLVSGALDQLHSVIAGLSVDEARMRDNLLASHGLINAEGRHDAPGRTCRAAQGP